MLYASTRNNLTKSLGSTHFKDSLFANSKDDVSFDAYKRHRAHLAAHKPMTEREKELAEIKAAERAAGGSGYEANREKRSHIGDRVGFQWSAEADEAVKALQDSGDARLIVLVSRTVGMFQKSKGVAQRICLCRPSMLLRRPFTCYPIMNAL